jgi:hypothetical protein
MTRGFVAIPRQLADAVRKEGAEPFFLWFELWSRAAWSERVAQLSHYGPISLRRGQLILSVNATARELKIDRSKVRRCIERWERIGWIRREPLPIHRPTNTSANLPSLLTIVNYDDCDTRRADVDQPPSQSTTSRRTNGDPEQKREVRRVNKKGVSEPQRAEPSMPRVGLNNSHPGSPRKLMSEGQFLYLTSQIAKWREDYGDIFVGGDGDSLARAFQREFGMTTEYWQDVQRRFAHISGTS